jgi:uncharacterized protein YbaR (Trm112 family)/ubiquinone/menaquinone biosynthesis C-methylase UbiE
MRLDLLEILQCPYCGGSFAVDDGPTLRRSGDEIITGVLRCQCASYPVVDGVPVLMSAYAGDTAFQQLLADDPESARFTALELDGERQAAFMRFLARGDAGTYRDCIEIFSPGEEGQYFVHRFANPTYLVGQAVLRAIGSDRRLFTRRAIDLAGGSGHLTRALCQIAGGAEVLLAETNFWKLWIARRIVAPEVIPVCCDAESPLPFKRGAFSLALCSDAFHYIWSKRQLACEMTRMVGDDGVIVVNHAHNALTPNYSAGLPLAPRWWRNLLADYGARVFKESAALDSVIERRAIDLSRDYSDEELACEEALFLIATRTEEIFRRYEYPGAQFDSGVWRVNPLYEIERSGNGAVLRLQFPSPSYEDEYKACKRYLPERLELTAEAVENLEAGKLDGELRELADRYVALSVPKGYL